MGIGRHELNRLREMQQLEPHRSPTIVDAQPKPSKAMRSFLVGGKGMASITEPWQRDREQCFSWHLPKYHCSLCKRSSTCKPHCGACAVLEVCKSTGWDPTTLTAQQIVQIQDAVLVGSTPVSRNEIEEPEEHQVIRVKPPDWSTRHPISLPGPPHNPMSAQEHADFVAQIHQMSKCARLFDQSAEVCGIELEDRMKRQRVRDRYCRIKMKYAILRGHVHSKHQLEKFKLDAQPPWLQIQFLHSAQWDSLGKYE